MVDYLNTKVLLIGASSFPKDASINPIPNVEINIELLKKCLIQKELAGIPEENIIVSLNERKEDIEEKLFNITEGTRNKLYTLIIYYSGHGMLSSINGQLYLTTHFTKQSVLEVGSLNIETFRSYINRSLAGRKIVILDCCHSGSLINTMGEISSTVQAELADFKGTYVMTSVSKKESSLFPHKTPDKPTYFTGKFLDVIHEGVDSENEYWSLREIFDCIDEDFLAKGFPRPQQANLNNADQLRVFKNTRFRKKAPDDKIEWEQTEKINSIRAYVDFRKKFPKSPLAKIAKQKIYNIEDNEAWTVAIAKNSVFNFEDYLERYPDGIHAAKAEEKIADLTNAFTSTPSGPITLTIETENQSTTEQEKSIDKKPLLKKNIILWTSIILLIVCSLVAYEHFTKATPLNEYSGLTANEYIKIDSLYARFESKYDTKVKHHYQVDCIVTNSSKYPVLCTLIMPVGYYKNCSGDSSNFVRLADSTKIIKIQPNGKTTVKNFYFYINSFQDNSRKKCDGIGAKLFRFNAVFE